MADLQIEESGSAMVTEGTAEKGYRLIEIQGQAMVDLGSVKGFRAVEGTTAMVVASPEGFFDRASLEVSEVDVTSSTRNDGDPSTQLSDFSVTTFTEMDAEKEVLVSSISASSSVDIAQFDPVQLLSGIAVTVSKEISLDLFFRKAGSFLSTPNIVTM